MFACPKCGRKTISLWAKLAASTIHPMQCSYCGGLFVVSRNSVLAAVGVAEVAAVPLLIAGPRMPLAAFASLVLLLAICGGVYSFGFAPLDQLAQREQQPAWTGTTWLLVIGLVGALFLIPAYAVFRL